MIQLKDIVPLETKSYKDLMEKGNPYTILLIFIKVIKKNLIIGKGTRRSKFIDGKDDVTSLMKLN